MGTISKITDSVVIVGGKLYVTYNGKLNGEICK
jgi:hypothetical protein